MVRARSAIPRLQQGLRELEGDPCAAEVLAGIAAARLVGVEDGERVRQAEAGNLRQMMIGDDEVEAQARGGFGSGEIAYAGVHADDQADALPGRGGQHLRLHAVAFAQTVRHMEIAPCRPASRWPS